MKVKPVFLLILLLTMFVLLFLVARTQVKPGFDFFQDLGIPISMLLFSSFFLIIVLICIFLIEIFLEKFGVHLKLDPILVANVIFADFYKIKSPYREFLNLLFSILISVFLPLTLLFIFIYLFSFFIS
jgi:hypothetical protein